MNAKSRKALTLREHSDLIWSSFNQFLPIQTGFGDLIEGRDLEIRRMYKTQSSLLPTTYRLKEW
jgi:hypothetical protein